MLVLSDRRAAALTCPRCGGTLRPRGLSFPRCPRCHELLVTCRYCLHYDRTVLDCGHPLLRERVHVSDPDLFTECPYHASTLVGLRAVPLRSRLIRMGVIAAVLIFGASLLTAFFHIVPGTPQHRLFMSITVPDQVSEGDPVSLSFLIWNASDEPAQSVVLALNTTYLSKFIFRSIDPEPSNVVPTASTRYFYYGPLGPGRDFRVNLAMTARRPGTHRLKAQLFSGRGLQRRIEDDTTILP